MSQETWWTIGNVIFWSIIFGVAVLFGWLLRDLQGRRGDKPKKAEFPEHHGPGL
jgi:hypothetical protein